MAKFRWALMCRRLLIDGPTNLVSYIDAVEGFGLPQFPFPCPPLVVGTLWDRENASEPGIQMRAIVRSPSGEILTAEEAPALLFEPQHTRGRVNLALQGFLLPAPGRYTITLEHKSGTEWREVYQLWFDVDQVVLQEATALAPVFQSKERRD